MEKKYILKDDLAYQNLKAKVDEFDELAEYFAKKHNNADNEDDTDCAAAACAGAARDAYDAKLNLDMYIRRDRLYIEEDSYL